jgi:hypothetical protein
MRLGWWPAVICLAAGISLRDCVVIAAAGPLGLCAFYAGMDRSAPMDAFRASMRCAKAGIISMLAAIALAIAVLAAVHGLWQPSHERLFAGAGVLAVSIATFALHFRGEGPDAPRVRPWLAGCMALVAGGASAAIAWNLEWSACALPFATAMLMALAGWRLLCEVASELLLAGRER